MKNPSDCRIFEFLRDLQTKFDILKVGLFIRFEGTVQNSDVLMHRGTQGFELQQPVGARRLSVRRIRHLERSPNVRFYVRFYPKNDEAADWRHLVIDSDQRTLCVRALQDMARLHPMWTYWQFNTDGLLIDTNQDVVFRTVLAPRLGFTGEGVDVVVMAFGEPGTGKTYTLTGLNKSYAERGLIPRALDEVIGRRTHTGYDFKTGISYVEFSENKCYDLLAPGKRPVEVNPTKIKPIEVPSSFEALDLLFRGEVKRKFENANLNCGSAVYTIHIQSQTLNANNPYTSHSKIHFVDVAGIETLWNSEKSDPCAISANLDKLSVDVTSRWAYYLSKAIAKPSKIRNLAVYGTSGLVSYLERSFTHGFVTLLGMIKPEGDKLRKTLSTLRFGCKVARLHTGLLDRHQQSSAAQKTANLKNEIDDLRAQIETSKLISLGEYDRFNVCQGEAQHIERLIKTYIKSDFPDSVSETCLLSTAKPYLLLEEIRRQFQAESNFITSHFQKKSIQIHERTQSTSIVSDTRKKSVPYKKKTRSSRASASQLFDASDFKDIAEQAAKGEDKDKDKSSTSTQKGGGGPRKSKSLGSRKSVASKKSMGPRKSKAGGGKTPKTPKQKGKDKASSVKTEPVLVPIDKEFLERGRKDRVWLMNEFLLRNKDVADEKESNERFFEMARDAKISKAKDIDEYRASLGRTRIWLYHLQSKRNLIDVGPLGDPGAPTEEEKTYLDKEKETREKIVKAIDELATLHSMLSDATQMRASFQEKLQARFKAWINEIYVDEKYELEEEFMTASKLDKEIPRQTVSPSQHLETKSEVDFLKLQESFFHKKLPIMPIYEQRK